MNYIDDIPEITQEYADAWFEYQEALPEILEEERIDLMYDMV